VSLELGITPSISDEAVHARTGKVWAEWFALLDAEGGSELSHKQMVAWLKAHTSLSPWWQQMVTVSYEQARGLRDKHEKTDGFQISVTKTVFADALRVYAAWRDTRRRTPWLPDTFRVTTATESKYLRILWNDGSRVDVNFSSTGTGKCRVAVNHGKLPDAATAERMKAFWKERLSVLADRLRQ
jgi:hypothetical protein